MSGSYKNIILERNRETRVATITVNRPEKHNALDQDTMESWLAALEDIRSDPEVRVVISKGAGRSFGSGLDLFYLRSYHKTALSDWERSSLPRRLADMIRGFPKVTIAQVHGYCLGHAFVNMCSHDLAFAASNAQIGMPEVPRGSFGQMATANLYHAGIGKKKAAMIHLTGEFVSGAEADHLGLISRAVEEAELEAYTVKVATRVATFHPAALSSAKIAVEMGSNLQISDAIKMDQLVGAWQQAMVDPTAHVEEYLASQAGGPKANYKRPDT